MRNTSYFYFYKRGIFMKKTFLSIVVTSLLFLSLFVPIFTWATPCDDANKLIKRSQQSPERAENLLNQALNMCPNHPAVLNDLANIKENQDKFFEALGLYQRALKADKQFAYAYAGMGDVLMKQQDYRRAAKSFQNFITLQNNKGHSDYVDDYKQRLKKAQDRIFISADEIFQALSVKRNHFIPKIGIPIQFGSGSSQVEGNKNILKQCREIAKAVHNLFRLDENIRIRIDGHTDNKGPAQDNKKLSKKRAESIKYMLIKLYVPKERLYVKEWGEEKPIESNETEHGRFLNRRVTLVRTK